jgi:hypothetical protein
MYKTMGLNDGEGGDIGYIYYSNLPGLKTTRVEELPLLEEKVKFNEFTGLAIVGHPKSSEIKELDIVVKPGEEILYLMKKTPGNEPASYKAQFFPRLNHRAACSPEEIRNLGKKS